MKRTCIRGINKIRFIKRWKSKSCTIRTFNFVDLSFNKYAKDTLCASSLPATELSSNLEPKVANIFLVNLFYNQNN